MENNIQEQTANVVADNQTPVPANTETTDQATDQGGQEQGKIFSDDQAKQIEDMIKQARQEQQREDQSRFDREVTRRKQTEQELEAIKTANMNEVERLKYENEQALKEIERRDQEAAEKELRLEKADELQRQELPLELRDILGGSSMSEFRDSIDRLQQMFDNWYNRKLEKYMRDNSSQPITTTTNGPQQPTIAGNPFVKGSADYNLTVQMELYHQNRSEYDRLKKEAEILNRSK
jgi:DNA repair exonuclease SbcCD ATPase subunit